MDMIKRNSGTFFSVLAACLLTVAAHAGAEEVKGKVKVVAGKAKTVSVAVENRGVMVFRYGDATVFSNARDVREIQPDDVVAIDYRAGEQGNLATSITKVVAKLPAGVREIKAAELAGLVRKGAAAGNYLLIDSRPPAKYRESHLPTAVSIPFAELEKEGEKLLPADKGTPLIFYCGGLTCVLSPKSAALAQKFGYGNIRVFAEGEPGWKKAEFDTESTVEFVKSGNIVLIDLRAAAAVEGGHIPRAVSIPAAKLGEAEKLFPSYKGAAIVFYGDNGAELRSALETMRDWGYLNATMFPGGTAAWQAAGNELKKGAAAASISYTRKLGPGEVSPADFKKALLDGSALIVDARSGEEFAAGHLAGALNIPAEEMARRHAELPRDKPLLIYCSTGARSEMGYDVLKDKGLSVKFLNAAVELAKDGKFTIAE